MMEFPYLEEFLLSAAPPSLPANSVSRWRPLLPVRIFGPLGDVRVLRRVLLDSGADDTIFPLDVAVQLQLTLRPDSGHPIRWQGQHHPLRYGDVELELSDGQMGVRWPATIGFTTARLRYPLLGLGGCWQFFRATFLGDQRAVEIDINPTFPGTTI